MSRPDRLGSEVDGDLRRAPRQRVVYLEGKDDPELLFALLGRAAPRDGLLDGVLVRGLSDRPSEGRAPGSGRSAVEARVRFAERTGRHGVFGFLDGDGRPLSELRALFDPPCLGPLFWWKAYCIENLLAKAAWPPDWGVVPAWPEALRPYAPYVGLNSVVRRLQDVLKTLDLHRFVNPSPDRPLLDRAQVLQRLRDDRRRLSEVDVYQEFEAATNEYLAALDRSTDEAHALLNGKWLVRHLVPNWPGIPEGLTDAICRSQWMDAVRCAGGLPEVRQIWARVLAERTSAPPRSAGSPPPPSAPDGVP